ncbi:hypothetical protein FCM35_KLT12142 [Carex littledalei]|uniref:Uncharacterized protein n=1 Tax=Carex littledalei TaxID=544730 RepID=A0A833V2R0_9POAL|nr:hypothetical protein FCM35_KLT12142 [Carex littledalei]
MVNEEAIQMKDVNKSNQEKENNAKSENIPEEFTEKFVVKKVEDFKKDVLEFSGFVSDGDEESQRDKVKERLERCTREMLTQLCSVFDISSTNAFYGKNKKELSSEMDTGTSLEIVHEEEDGNAPSNEAEEMKSSEKEENSTVSEKPKDRDVNLSKDILDMRANSSRGDPFFCLNARISSEKLTKSVWDLEKPNKKQKLTDEHFEMDISPRKGSIMVMIEEELYRLAVEAQEQESHEQNQEEKAKEKQDGNENNNCIQVPSGTPVQI